MRTSRALSMVTLALVLAGSACTGGDDVTNGTVPRPTTTLASCPVSVADDPEGWPISLPESLVATSYEIEERSYTATGITNDGERLLNQVLEVTLADFDYSEFDGGAKDLAFTYQSLVGEGSVSMDDSDEDGCWDVELAFTASDGVLVSDLVAAVDAAGSDGVSSSGNASESNGSDGLSSTPNPLVDPQGSGTLSTQNGTFSLLLETCDLGPTVDVWASSDIGNVSISGDASSGVEITLEGDETYEFGSNETTVNIAPGNSAMFVGNGDGSSGPQSVIVEVTCDE